MKVVATSLTADSSLSSHILKALEHAADEHSGIVTEASAYVADLERRCFGQHNADANIYPASVIKVPIMATVFREYVVGALHADDHVKVSAANQTATSGPAPFVPGYNASVAELVELMITHSDNVATNQLMDVLRRERVTAYMHELGLATFLLGRKLSGSEPLIEDPEQVGRNRLPANEIARLLLLIATDAIDGTSEQKSILKRCAHNDKLVPGLRAGDIFMHKTGETSDVSHDAGILETPDGKRLVVVLYCQVRPTADDADAVHANPFMTSWMRRMREML